MKQKNLEVHDKKLLGIKLTVEEMYLIRMYIRSNQASWSQSLHYEAKI